MTTATAKKNAKTTTHFIENNWGSRNVTVTVTPGESVRMVGEQCNLNGKESKRLAFSCTFGGTGVKEAGAWLDSLSGQQKAELIALLDDVAAHTLPVTVLVDWYNDNNAPHGGKWRQYLKTVPVWETTYEPFDRT